MSAALRSAIQAALMWARCPPPRAGKSHPLVVLRPHLSQHPTSRCRQRHAMGGLLLGGGAGLDPDAGFEVEVGPPGGQKLAAPRAGQQQQPHGVGCSTSLSSPSASVSRANSAVVR